MVRLVVISSGTTLAIYTDRWGVKMIRLKVTSNRNFLVITKLWIEAFYYLIKLKFGRGESKFMSLSYGRVV